MYISYISIQWGFIDFSGFRDEKVHLPMAKLGFNHLRDHHPSTEIALSKVVFAFLKIRNFERGQKQPK
jgi:hypothetical protein